jgi:hypothetical protein
LQQGVNALLGHPVLKSDAALVRQEKAKAAESEAAKAKTPQTPSAEKKTLDQETDQAEHYRVTPNGIIRVQ